MPVSVFSFFSRSCESARYVLKCPSKQWVKPISCKTELVKAVNKAARTAAIAPTTKEKACPQCSLHAIYLAMINLQSLLQSHMWQERRESAQEWRILALHKCEQHHHHHHQNMDILFLPTCWIRWKGRRSLFWSAGSRPCSQRWQSTRVPWCCQKTGSLKRCPSQAPESQISCR